MSVEADQIYNLKNPDAKYVRAWHSILAQKRTYLRFTMALACLRKLKEISPMLKLIQQSLQSKIKELAQQNYCEVQESYVFTLNHFLCLRPEEVKSKTVFFPPLFATSHLEVAINEKLNKVISLEPYVQTLKEIMGYMTVLQKAIETTDTYNEKDEMFCAKIFPLMLRIAVLLHPLGEANADTFIRDFLAWVSRTFLFSSTQCRVNEEFKNRLGLQICKGTLSIFSHATIFSILTSPATEYIAFLKDVINSRFGPKILSFCPVVVSSLLVQCKLPTGDVKLKEENYWLALDMTMYIIRIIAEGNLQKSMSQDDIDAVIDTFPLLFESNVGVVFNGEMSFCNGCLMTHLIMLITSNFMTDISEVICGGNVLVHPGSLTLMLAATGNIPLLKLFVKSLHCYIREAASLGHFMKICATIFIVQFVLQENKNALYELDSERRHLKEILHAIIFRFSEARTLLKS